MSPSTYSDFDRKAVGLVKRKPLDEMTDEELLELMFTSFKTVSHFKWITNDYSREIENNFKKGNGATLEWTFKEWPNRKVSNLDNLLNALTDKIYLAYRSGFPENVTPEIQANMINFSHLRTLGEFVAFGGIQEVELKGYLSKVKHAGKGDYFTKFGDILHDPTVLEVRLEFVLKDWFGVDEEDVYKNSIATKLGRDYLAAFWILQHRRGYQPFINVIKYKETKDYSF